MKIAFSLDDEKNSLEIITDITHPFIYSAFLSAMMHEIRPFLANKYELDDKCIEACMISIKDAANLACAGLDDNSYIEEYINQSIKRRMKKNDTEGASDVSV